MSWLREKIIKAVRLLRALRALAMTRLVSLRGARSATRQSLDPVSRLARKQFPMSMSWKKLPLSIFNLLMVLMVVSLVFPAEGYGFGLEVDPVEIVVQGCPLGAKTAVSELGGEKMRIENKGTTAYIYEINILNSKQTNTPLRTGYQDIPDTSWVIAENKEVRIPANSIGEVDLYLKIPESKKYYDKRYQAIIEVKSKKNKPEDIFVLAVQIRMCFSTIKAEVAK